MAVDKAVYMHSVVQHPGLQCSTGVADSFHHFMQRRVAEEGTVYTSRVVSRMAAERRRIWQRKDRRL
jgi:hypothetical protein